MPSVPNIQDSRYTIATGRGFDGVVRINSGNLRASGVLLPDGLHVLTAAHLVADHRAEETWVTFETQAGIETRKISAIAICSDYDSTVANNDLAIITLATTAPTTANRYTLYRDSGEIGQTFVFAGYGLPSTGDNGAVILNEAPYVRRGAENRFEGSMDFVKFRYPDAIRGDPLPHSTLFADFDNGLTTQDAAGKFFGQYDLGLGAWEGIPSAGDSGGPAFIGNKIAGIADYGFLLDGYGNMVSDINIKATATFGEFSAWQRVSFYQQWIDQRLRADYADAPAQPAEVQKTVLEGNGGTVTTWFLVTLSHPAVGGGQIQFHTSDGSAKAGVDYLPVADTLKFYAGEDHIAIPVEVIGNMRIDGNRNFSLVVTDPVGGVFAGGVNELTASRTIVDDDGPALMVGIADPVIQPI